MNRSIAAAAALLLGLCAVLPSAAHAEEWRWCVAGDLLDSGRTNGPNLISRPFQTDGAPDFQAQYETYVRSIMGPIEGEFILNCSPAFPDHDAAMRHSGEWSLSMHDMTGGLFEAEDVFWAPTYAASSATIADPPRSHDHATARDSATAASAQQATTTDVAARVETQGSDEPTRMSSQPQQEDTARAEQRRQEWERQRVAAQQGGASTEAGAGSGAKPLRFVLMMPMMPRAGDTHNPACYSNIITRPGPPGWGAPGFLPPGSGEQANRTIDSLKAAFIARCRAASGREAQSEGNFRSHWNQSERDESDLDSVRARFQEDVTVQMD
jgi:hypothetical protein